MLRHHAGLTAQCVFARSAHRAMPLVALSSHSALGAVTAAPHAAAAPMPLLHHQQRRSFAVKVAKKDDKNKKGANTKNDAAKKKKKKKGSGGDDKLGRLNVDLSVLETMLEQQLTAPAAEETRSDAELALDNDYAKEYSRRCMAAHKRHRAGQMRFLRSRWTAVNSLPTPLRNEALKEDMTPWPKNFYPIPWTPREYVKRFGGQQQTEAAAATTEGKK